MSNETPSTKQTLAGILRRLNEGLDDFSCKPAKSAQDQGAFEDYPLHKIAIWGDVEAAEVLLENGADLEARGEDGETALHRAVGSKQVLMIKFLIARGANRDAKDSYGKSPLDWAIQSNNSELVEAIKLETNAPVGRGGS